MAGTRRGEKHEASTTTYSSRWVSAGGLNRRLKEERLKVGGLDRPAAKAVAFGEAEAPENQRHAKKGSKGSLRGKFKRADWDDRFLCRLLEMF
ncbi:MAG: hypothetical protein ACP5E2_02425 [Terracidiphilus sp.]